MRFTLRFMSAAVVVAACGAPSPIAPTDASKDSPGEGPGETTSRVPTMHRATATACPQDRPASSCTHVSPGMANPTGAGCDVDDDCVGGTNGRCVGDSPNAGYCDVCSYDVCFSDADCTGAGPCDCRSSRGANVCSAGNCRVDADCGAGGYCSPSLSSCPGYPDLQAKSGFYCHLPKDECFDDSDCEQSQPNICRYDGTEWRCMEFGGCPA